MSARLQPLLNQVFIYASISDMLIEAPVLEDENKTNYIYIYIYIF